MGKEDDRILKNKYTFKMNNLKVKQFVTEVLIFSVLILGAIKSNAQVGIGIMTADPSAQLDVSSTTKGFLPPRMTLLQRSAIADPASGLVVFCTDCGQANVGGELQVFSGGIWRNLMGGAASEGLPIVTTAVVAGITGYTAASGGTITSDGGSAISAKGVCWSTSQNPTIANSITTDAGTTSTYTSELIGLAPNTTYYLRAYATNASFTGYGTQITFATLIGAPVVAATAAAYDITRSNATSGGTITSDGGSIITARGVCWSTSQNPTIANSVTTDAGTTGTYTSSISGLIENEIYYVRAYATNAIGTTYGTQITFKANLSIGAIYGGGIVIYVQQPSDVGYVAGETHGLIAATVDQSAGIIWYNGTNTNTGATGTAIGTGLGNTNLIIANQGGTATNYAAGIARAYTGGGYTDWFLPSKGELNLMYQIPAVLATMTFISDGFTNFPKYYWSSSEYTNNYAWFQDFANSTNNIGYQVKYLGYRVRAIRAF